VAGGAAWALNDAAVGGRGCHRGGAWERHGVQIYFRLYDVYVRFLELWARFEMLVCFFVWGRVRGAICMIVTSSFKSTSRSEVPAQTPHINRMLEFNTR
jgi:hypothetical protein